MNKETLFKEIIEDKDLKEKWWKNEKATTFSNAAVSSNEYILILKFLIDTDRYTNRQQKSNIMQIIEKKIALKK